ncbi:MAG: acyltransferase family protein [Treponema sp.]|nr:acyltransferase family protein [Treponema sp.]
MTIPMVSIIVYGAWLALLLVGSRRAPKGSFHQDFMSLEATKNLQGFAALGVICHHLSQPPQNGGPMDALGQMQLFREIGFCFVAVFFFVSGYGLLKSLESKPNYLDKFARRRILPIVVCFYVMNLFYIAFHLALGTKMPVSEWICKITGVALLNDNAWFVPVIIVMYLAFYAAFKKGAGQTGANSNRAFAFVFAVIALQIGWFLFNKHFTWWWGERDWWKKPGALFLAPWYKRPVALWYEGEWWVNSTIAFFVGMLFARNEKSVVEFFKRAWVVKLIISILLFVGAFAFKMSLWENNIHYWLEFSGDNTTLPRVIMFSSDTLLVLTWLLFLCLLRMKIWTKNRVFELWGKYSLEFYLMQAIPLRAFSILFGWSDKSFRAKEGLKLGGWNDQLMALAYLVLAIAATMLLGIIVKFVTQRIVGLFFEKRGEKA